MANNEITLLRYTDPERKNLAHAAAVYLGKPDTDNIRRPLTIMKKRHALAIFRGESCRFEFETSKVVYDHLITYTTADMRACAGLRANEAAEFMPPAEDDDPVFSEIAAFAFEKYKDLIRGIDPLTQDPQKKKRLQAARSILPMSTKIKYEFQFNFLTLITIFQQRIWTPGAQEDTKQVVQAMWEIVHSQDPELWSTVFDEFGPEEQGWIHSRQKLKKEDPQLYKFILEQYGKIKTMW
jgi:thymidylate synthase ThyX